ncbi:hypothetical protein BP5796_11178 [Coleophoma crateriformis]|uniref:DUF5672 domain-containing protein n=1 Tax=Coleophoma crateriformis TaxID=565419 RepID=A0A3D8QHH7_9HELO|nr:hypothetical protein BP5796_11178 [Coleophoma crateriformis]
MAMSTDAALKEHEVPFSPSRIPWQHRRLQRCLTFAIVSVVLLCALLYYKSEFIPDLRLDSLAGIHKYTSAPEVDVSFIDETESHKASASPLFEVPALDEEPEEEEPLAPSSKATDVPSTAIHSTSTSASTATSTADSAVVATIKPEPAALATTVTLDPTKIALLLDTRPVPHIPALLLHFISVLPAEWTFRFVGSEISLGLVNSSVALQRHVRTGKLVLTKLPPQYAVNSQEAISATLTDITFYRDFLAPAEWVLNFQTDSMICSASEHNIDEWVSQNYSWVGAPWHLGNQYGGNGGLSLRHIPPIVRVLEAEKRVPESEWEDLWLCNRLGMLPEANMPPPSVERHFSVEAIWTEKPFGYHLRGSGALLAGEIWDKPELRKQIYNYCPEIKIVLSMELEGELNKARKELSTLKEKVAAAAPKEELTGIGSKGD